MALNGLFDEIDHLPGEGALLIVSDLGELLLEFPGTPDVNVCGLFHLIHGSPLAGATR